MGHEAGTIRQDIEETRERLGETVDALAYKTDVGARARDKVSDGVDRVKNRLGVAQDAVPGAADVRQQGRRVSAVAQENPLGFAVGAIAVGFVAGLLIPNTKAEDRHLAPVKEAVGEQAHEAAETVAEHGRDTVQEAADAARGAAGDMAQTVRDHAREAGDELGVTDTGSAVGDAAHEGPQSDADAGADGPEPDRPGPGSSPG